MSHHWLTTWWHCFGGKNQLHVIIVKTGNEWVAAAPMMVEDAVMCGVPVRRLCSFYNHHTPRFEMVVREHSHDIYNSLWNAISQKDAGWDVVLLPQLVAGSPSLSAFERIAQASGWRTGQWAALPSPFVRLSSESATLFGMVRNKGAANMRRCYRKLCRKGAVDMEVIADPEAVRIAMQDGLRIEAAAWKGQAGTAMRSDPAVERFYVEFAEKAAAAGELRLIFLCVDGKRIAFDYVLRRDRALYAVKIGYDPEYRRYSPGHLLLGMILRDATQDGILEYDFLGADDEWKRLWTNEMREHRWLFMFRDSVRGTLIHHLKFGVLPVIRKQVAFNYVRGKLLGFGRTA
jgi:hypothetical protein